MLDAITGVFSPLRQLFEMIRSGRRARNERVDEALSSLYTALNETRLYIASLSPRHVRVSPYRDRPLPQRNREVEEKLSRLWIAAAIQLRHIDHDLADRCYVKSDYWVDPERWAEAAVQGARIEIERVFKEARKLL